MITRALMYHDVVPAPEADTSGFPGADAALYKVTPEQFAAHLDAIRRRLGADTAPAITFDDGGIGALRAADALERRGLFGYFFVTANYIGTRGFLGDGDIRSLRRRGHVIGSHSCSHPLRMGHCSWRQLVDEWTRSCGTLAGILGEPVEIASVPGGDFAPPVAEAAAAAGIAQLFTSEPTATTIRIAGVLVRGRYTIQRWTTAGTAAALAAGDWLPAARQAVVWNVKKISKRVGGERYLQLRRLLLGHRNEVRWGDQQ